MLYQENPLIESFNKLYRKASTLSPEARKEFMRQYAKSRFSSDGTLWDAATNYGKRSLKGQMKRAKALAKEHGRGVAFTQVPKSNGLGPLDSITSPSGSHKFTTLVRPDGLSDKFKRLADQGSPKDIIQIASANDTIHPVAIRNMVKYPQFINASVIDKQVHIPNKRAARKFRKFAANLDSTNPALTNSNLTQHEIDEYDTLLKLSKKHGMSPIDISTINAINRGLAPGGHLPGVLKKEFDRTRQLSDMFGRDKLGIFTRPKSEYATNAKPFSIPNGYQDNPIWKQIQQLRDSGMITG